MQDDVDELRTIWIPDMGLVTYLKTLGHPPIGYKWASGSCHWEFVVTEGFQKAVEDYTKGEAFVDPREYSRKMSTTRDEFYKLKHGEQVV